MWNETLCFLLPPDADFSSCCCCFFYFTFSPYSCFFTFLYRVFFFLANTKYKIFFLPFHKCRNQTTVSCIVHKKFGVVRHFGRNERESRRHLYLFFTLSDPPHLYYHSNTVSNTEIIITISRKNEKPKEKKRKHIKIKSLCRESRVRFFIFFSLHRWKWYLI